MEGVGAARPSPSRKLVGFWRRPFETRRNTVSGRQLNADPLAGRKSNLEITAYLPREGLIDLTVARNRGRLACTSVNVHRMARTFTEQGTTVRLKMPNQIAPVHPAAIVR